MSRLVASANCIYFYTKNYEPKTQLETARILEQGRIRQPGEYSGSGLVLGVVRSGPQATLLPNPSVAILCMIPFPKER